MKNREIIKLQREINEWGKLVDERLDAFLSGDELKHKNKCVAESMLRKRVLDEMDFYFDYQKIKETMI